MPDNLLAFPRRAHRTVEKPTAGLLDQVHLALAIADEGTLKSLLVDCVPAIAPAHVIGSVTSTVEVPLQSNGVADGLLQFETVHCVLTDHPPSSEELSSFICEETADAPRACRDLLHVTQCQSSIQTLGQNLTGPQALSILRQVGFAPDQMERILHLPQEAWHKSWWYFLNEFGDRVVPFQRLIRTRHYSDGTYTIQYRDLFAQEPPSCFRSSLDQVLIAIRRSSDGFRSILCDINRWRQQLGIAKAILVCDSLSDAEAEGFIRQGVSLYPATDLLIPVQADCAHCATQDCPMQGIKHSPVRTCDRFCLEGHLDDSGSP